MTVRATRPEDARGGTRRSLWATVLLAAVAGAASSGGRLLLAGHGSETIRDPRGGAAVTAAWSSRDAGTETPTAAAVQVLPAVPDRADENQALRIIPPQPPLPEGLAPFPTPPPMILPPAIPPDEPAAEGTEAPEPGVLIEAVESPESIVELIVNRSKLFRLTRPLSGRTLISYDNERVVLVQPLADPDAADLRYINLLGIGFGEATVRMIDQERGLIQTIRVRVTIDEQSLRERVEAVLPGADVTIRQIAQNVVLEGQVADPKMMSDLLELVRSELRLSGQASVGSLAGSLGFGGGPSGGNRAAPPAAAGGTTIGTPVPPSAATAQGAQPGLVIINRVRVRGPRQVMLKVKIAEMNRTALRQLGVNFQRVTDGDVIGSIVGNIATVGTTPGSVIPNPLDTQLFGIFDEGQFSLVLNALRQNQIVRILATPTLVTLDGQPARFLAGGSFPFPVPQVGVGGFSTITIQFRDFGALLQFLPTILEDDTIRLDVEPIFSELNPVTGTSVNGTAVPGLTERSAHTVVQLREGQTLAIAGLFQTRQNGTIRRVPLLGDLPVVGQLFARSEVAVSETELIVLVTPELVDPIDGPPPPAPGDFYQEPNDLEFFFLGRLEGRTRHPHRSTVNYLDPFQIMKHFRSEDHWVVGPHGFAD